MEESMSEHFYNACPDFWILEFKKKSQSTLNKIFFRIFGQVYRVCLLFYFHESINQWDDDTFQQKNDSFKLHSNAKDNDI